MEAQHQLGAITDRSAVNDPLAIDFDREIFSFQNWKSSLVFYFGRITASAMNVPFSTAQKIVTRPQLLARALSWRLKSRKIVFTNGCFDILHLGHVDYLEKARSFADRLVVGLNSDASVRRQGKGAERPLQSEDARSRIMAALEFVDAVCLFDEDTPLDLIVALEPDVLVKGDDYTVDQIVGAKEVLSWGGAVQTIPLVQGHSTTNIVRKIQSSLHG
jgi:rfaE bifunctional protein nucleotidyltransferase chain/domain